MADSPADRLAIVPIALLLHNIEESVAVGFTLPGVQVQLSRALGDAIRLPSVEQYWLALAILSGVGFALFILARANAALSYGLVVLQAVMALNVAAHVVVAVWLRGYAPGIVTAALVELPASVLVYRSLHASNWMSRRQWVLLPLWAALVHGPGLLGLLALVRSV